MLSAAPRQVPVADVVDLVKKWVAATRELADASAAIDADRDRKSTSPNGALRSQIVVNRSALKRIDAAAALLPEESRFQPNSTEREANTNYRSALVSLRHGLEAQTSINERMVSLEGLDFIMASGEIMEQILKTREELDAAWAALAPATHLMTASLVDVERVTDGTLQHLRLTTSQRQALLDDIERAFPKAPSRVAATLSGPLNAIAVIKNVLTGPYRPADVR